MPRDVQSAVFRTTAVVAALFVGLGWIAPHVAALPVPAFVPGLQAATAVGFQLLTPSTLWVCNAEPGEQRQAGRPSPQARKRNPARMRARTGADVKGQFLRAISPAALAAAVKLGEERGWKRTDSFTVIEPDVRPGVTLIQDGDIDLGEGRVLVWDWDTMNPELAGGTLIVETWNPSTSTTFLAEYWAGDDWGVTTWARFLEGRDRYGHLTREVSLQGRGIAGSIGLLKVGFRQTCAQQKAEWRSCMRECLKERLNTGLWASVLGGMASARTCAQYGGKAGVAGPYVGLGVFAGCMIGGAATAGAAAMVYQFGVRPSCDSAGVCGSAPSCE